MHLDNLTIGLVVQGAAAELLCAAGGDTKLVGVGHALLWSVFLLASYRSCTGRLPQLVPVVVEVQVNVLFHFVADVRVKHRLANFQSL